MLTLTPGRGPGKSRPRAGTWTCAYIKNNNKNLLALQTAQPAPGDGLAWHSGTSKPHGLVQRAARPGHHRTHADAACSTACILEPPLSQTQEPTLQILPSFKQKYALFPCFSRRGFSPP